jgi:hypothetical protein
VVLRAGLDTEVRGKILSVWFLLLINSVSNQTMNFAVSVNSEYKLVKNAFGNCLHISSELSSGMYCRVKNCRPTFQRCVSDDGGSTHL